MAIAVERPVSGVVKLSSSVLYGEPDDTEESGETETEVYGGRKARKSNP